MYNEFIENRSRSVDTLAATDYCVTEKGDVNRPKSAGIKIKKKSEEKLKEQDICKMQLSEASSPFRVISERAPLIDLNGLLNISPEPLPSLRTIKTSQGQISLISDQVNRISKDMAKLQQIAEEYKCMEKYKADIDYLVVHLSDAIVNK